MKALPCSTPLYLLRVVIGKFFQEVILHPRIKVNLIINLIAGQSDGIIYWGNTKLISFFL